MIRIMPEGLTEIEKECFEIETYTRCKTVPRGNGFEIKDMTVGELKKRLEGLDDSAELSFKHVPKEDRKQKRHHKYIVVGYWDKSYLDMCWEPLIGFVNDEYKED